MAGFGGGGGGAKKDKKDKKKSTPPAVLKPKAQWDRYGSMKEAAVFKVATRVAMSEDGSSDAGGWWEVGTVKSEGDEFTELAVFTQRGIIADVS